MLVIDGEEVTTDAIIKSNNNFYYEGTLSKMLIINKQNGSRYNGPVKSLT